MTRARLILDAIRRDGPVTIQQLAMLCDYPDAQIANAVRYLAYAGNVERCAWEQNNGLKPLAVYRFARSINPSGAHRAAQSTPKEKAYRDRGKKSLAKQAACVQE
jgi:DeoR/GlpR family transcriptional regulator of sugar metabolism